MQMLKFRICKKSSMILKTI